VLVADDRTAMRRARSAAARLISCARPAATTP
jgi:hypothetical protein